MGFFNGIKNFTIGAAKIFTPIGESIGSALATPYASGLEEESLKRNLELQTRIQESAKAAKTPEQKAKVLKISQNMGDYKSIIDQVDAFKETPVQTYAKAAITATTFAGGLSMAGSPTGALRTASTALKSKPAVDFIAGAGGVQRVSRLAKLTAQTANVAKHFGVGAGFGTLFALQEGKTKPKEIAKEAAMVGAFNVVAPAIIGKTLGATGKLLSNATKLAGKGFEKGLTTLERLAEKPLYKTTNELDEFINIAHGDRYTPVLKNTIKNITGKTAEAGRFLQDIPSRLKTIVLDRMSPIANLGKQTSEILNRPISFTNDPYKTARRTSGVIDGKFQIAAGKHPIDRVGMQKQLDDGIITQETFDDITRLDDIGTSFRSIVNDFQNVQNEADAYIAAKNALDRVKLGNKVVGNKTKEQIQSAIDIAEGSKNAEMFKQYDKLVKGINEKVLEIRKNAGLITDADIANFKKTHPNYVPNKVLDFFEEGGMPLSDMVKPAGTRFSVTESGIKGAKGSTRDIMNPVEAMVVDLKKAITDAERNKVASQIIEQGKLLGEDFGYRMVTPEDKAIDLAKSNLGKISRFKDGIKEDWIVPKDIEFAAKNLDTPEVGLLTKILGVPTSILKAGATRYNASFIFRNPARDIQTAIITSEKGMAGSDWVKTLLQAKGKDSSLYDLWRYEGGSISGLLSKQSTPKSVLRAINDFPTLTEKAIDNNPFALIEKAGGYLEDTTRLAVFRTSISNGLTPAESAWQARNATIDFSKMGSGMAVANKIIPFLNARVQGFSNIVGAAVKDPTVFVRRQLWSSVYPAMLLNSYNNQYESYNNIDQNTKDMHWIIMLGEENGFDEGGNPIKIPNAIRIPKGESQQAVANTVDNFLQFTKGNDFRSWEEFTGDLAITISPVSGVSSLGPIATPFELATNFDLFRKKKIIPDYIKVGSESFESKDLENQYKYTKYTSETAKRIGQWFDIAPTQVDFINGKLFGGLGVDIFKSLDLATGSEYKKKSGMLPNQSLSIFEKMAQTPVMKGFLTTSTYGAFVKDIELAEKVRKDLANPRFIKNQQAEIMYESLKKMDKDEARKVWEYTKKEDKQLYKLFNEIYKDEKEGLNHMERLTKNMGVENGERANYIFRQLNLLDNIDAKRELYLRLLKLKLITPEVRKGLDALQKREGELME